ncbi:hypothetical protein TREAZ_3064 [Leadbettera azotonutricia ZAS-9]|uniref:Uncharacterized protein n=1 Tax=Leadbettera azotonutricia (strain ATCC BAA-888 / DSM 13862 / ZAS-9) TaxID=545695 RepID=F5YAK1_LEAAZ|nr:hypothetical protein TREAZ_3064 [Leadbettera azotonutricia ZAS-9]
MKKVQTFLKYFFQFVCYFFQNWLSHSFLPSYIFFHNNLAK